LSAFAWARDDRFLPGAADQTIEFVRTVTRDTAIS
jgi:hypothetical protein